MAERTWTSGEVLADKYRLTRELGRGGMGAVWQAEHLVLRSAVAIKLIRARGDDVDGLRARFLREAQSAAALRSPHVVQILDYGVHEDTPFIAMELLEGESLAQRLQRTRVLSPAETARIVTHVARAIQKAHEAGVVHRDLKPDNIFLVHNADDEIAKVLDFGIAKTLVGDNPQQMATQTGAVLGTPHYMSPEQARGARAVDHRTDIWALGVIAFQCLTGARPFESTVLGDLLLKICAEPVPPPSSLGPVPAGFDQWFFRATAREPEQRFQTALEMAEVLRLLVGGSLSLPPTHAAPTAAIVPGAMATPAASAPTHPIAFDTGQQLGVSHTAVAVQGPAPSGGGGKWLLLGVAALGLVALAVAGFVAVVYMGVADEPGGVAASSAPTATTAAPEAELAPSAAPDPQALKPGTAAQVSPAVGVAQPSAAVGVAQPSAADAGSGKSWQTDVAKAQQDAKNAQDDAKKAQADAKKAQEDAAKAAAEAEAIRKKALEGLPK